MLRLACDLWDRVSHCTEVVITAWLNFGTVFVGRSVTYFWSCSDTGSLNYTGCDAWHTGLHRVSEPQGPRGRLGVY